MIFYKYPGGIAISDIQTNKSDNTSAVIFFKEIHALGVHNSQNSIVTDIPQLLD